jgi:predicted DNA-binding transcriptional regulator YafY
VTAAKTERLLNLLNLVVGADLPVTAAEIRRRVPGYPQGDDTFRRQFERDKRDIREMGLPMEPIVNPANPEAPPGYRIRRDEAYLRDPDLDPDELEALHLAAEAVRLEGLEGHAALLKLGGRPTPPAPPAPEGGDPTDAGGTSATADDPGGSGDRGRAHAAPPTGTPEVSDGSEASNGAGAFLSTDGPGGNGPTDATGAPPGTAGALPESDAEVGTDGADATAATADAGSSAGTDAPGLTRAPAPPRRVVRDPARRTAALPVDPRLVVVFSAVAARRHLRFGYRGETRELDPYRLDCARGRWYVSGFDHGRGATRAFRFDRIEGPIEPGPDGSFPEPAERTPGVRMEAWRFAAQDPVTARLLVDDSHLPEVRQAIPDVVIVEDRGDGGAVLELEVSNPEAFRGLVLGFLDHVEVLGPPALREDLVAWLEELVDAPPADIE